MSHKAAPALRSGVFALGLAVACGSDPAPPADLDRDAMLRGYNIYEQVSWTFPVYSKFENNLQLVARPDDPDVVMDVLDIQPGITMADIGSGVGFYTTRFAKAVGPEGTVYAIDIQETTVRELEARLVDPRLNPYGNVVTVVGKPDDVSLPDDAVDLAFLAFADFYTFNTLMPENMAMIASCYDAIKPGGELFVMQEKFKAPAGSRDAVWRNFAAAGFDRAPHQHDPIGTASVFVFRKPAAPAEPDRDGGRKP